MRLQWDQKKHFDTSAQSDIEVTATLARVLSYSSTQRLVLAASHSCRGCLGCHCSIHKVVWQRGQQSMQPSIPELLLTCLHVQGRDGNTQHLLLPTSKADMANQSLHSFPLNPQAASAFSPTLWSRPPPSRSQWQHRSESHPHINPVPAKGLGWAGEERREKMEDMGLERGKGRDLSQKAGSQPGTAS